MPSIFGLLQSLAKVGPVVNLGYAAYQGTTVPDAGIDYFFGIRYAAPPTGDLRFQAPQPPLKEQDVILANQIQNVCPQANHSHPLYTKDVYGNEDCLFLNVFKPSDIEGSQLPVMVYIHEGGYAAGGNANHDPTHLIHLSNFGTIAVTVQYRLGAFGFLSSSEVGRKGALNAGLLDQKSALEWVQENIHHFGGDPDQVTIWGLSAGGGSVLNHVIAYNGSLGTSLFRGAIANSPYLPPAHLFDSDISERNYQLFVKEAGCGDAEDAFTCLVDSDMETLMKSNGIVSASGSFGTYTWMPVLDNNFLTTRPSQQLLSGRINGERIIAGSNMHETLMKIPFSPESYAFLPSNITTEDDVINFIHDAFPHLPESVYNMLGHFYPKPEQANNLYNDMIGRVAAISGEALLNCPSYWLVQAFPADQAYHYEWQVPPATHGQDLIASFPDDFASPPEIEPLRLAYALPMVSFIVHGDPNFLPQKMMGEMAPVWPVYSKGLQARFTANGPKVGGSNDLGREERCAFWRSLGSLIPYR